MVQTRKQSSARLASLFPAELLRAVSDPRRIEILSRLACARAPCTVSEIASRCPIDLSVVSRHLAVLRDAGVLESARTGREVRYTLQTARVVAALRALADALESCCATPRESE